MSKLKLHQNPNKEKKKFPSLAIIPRLNEGA